MKLEKDEFNKLCANISVKMASDFDIFAKLGFTNVGDLVHYLEEYKDD